MAAFRTLAARAQSCNHLFERDIQMKDYWRIPTMLQQPLIQKECLRNSPRIPIEQESHSSNRIDEAVRPQPDSSAIVNQPALSHQAGDHTAEQ